MFTRYLLKQEMDDENLLIINTLTGAVDIIAKEKYFSILAGDTNSEEYEILLRRGYLKDEQMDQVEFQQVVDYYSKKSSVYTRRLNLLLVMTMSCNLRCRYCFQGHKIHGFDDILTHEQIDKAFYSVENGVLDIFNKEDYAVTLFGGEPLQAKCKESVIYTLETIRRKNKFLNIVTNGYELGEFIPILKKYSDIISIQVTLDGIEDIHNKNRPTDKGGESYATIVKNIDESIQNQLKIVLRINTNQYSSYYLKDFLEDKQIKKWLQYEGFKINIAPVLNHFGTEISCMSLEYNESDIFDSIINNFPDIDRFLGKQIQFTPDMFRMTGYLRSVLGEQKLPYKINPVTHYCEATHLSTFAVSPDNNIYLCPETIGKQEYSAGKYYPDLKLEESFINQFRDRGIDKISECMKCNIATLCGGGCPISAYKKQGNAKMSACGNAKDVVYKKMTDFTNNSNCNIFT